MDAVETTAKRPDVLDDEQRATALSLPDQASFLTVTSPEELDFAAEWLREVVVPLKEQIRSTFRPHIQRAHELHRMLIADEKRFLEPVEQAETLVKRTIGVYHERVERERQELERRARLEQEARELRAKTLAAITAIHEQLSYAAECMELDRERREAAERAAEAGDDEVADALRDEIGKHDELPPPPLPLDPELFVEPAPVAEIPAPAKAEGASVRANWKGKVTDMGALVAHIAKHPELRGLIRIDQPALDRLAKTMREGLKTIPGLEAVRENVVSVRRRS